MKPDRSNIVLLIIKSTLEYNAGITALATLYIGFMDSPKYHKRFLEEYKRYTKEYMAKQKELSKDLAKLITG